MSCIFFKNCLWWEWASGAFKVANSLPHSWPSVAYKSVKWSGPFLQVAVSCVCVWTANTCCSNPGKMKDGGINSVCAAALQYRYRPSPSTLPLCLKCQGSDWCSFCGYRQLGFSEHVHVPVRCLNWPLSEWKPTKWPHSKIWFQQICIYLFFIVTVTHFVMWCLHSWLWFECRHVWTLGSLTWRVGECW